MYSVLLFVDLDNSVCAVEALEVFVVVVAAEGDGHLAADGGVPDGGDGGGESAVDPTLLEVPKRRNNQMISPRGSKSILSSARFQLGKAMHSSKDSFFENILISSCIS